MEWSFTKMQGAGNDFVVLDGVRQAIEMTPKIAQAIADRHFGIGADQILLVDTPLHPEADFRYRIFNADGSEVQHCGNGARCFVRFVHSQGLSKKNPLKAEICTGLITLHEHSDQTVSVQMGKTQFEPEALPFDISNLPMRKEHEQNLYSIEINETTFDLAPISISNPHVVIQVTTLNHSIVQTVGSAIESHPRFAERVNVGFMQILNPQEINLRVYERGAGETLACGTGACAAVATGIRRGLLKSPVLVHMRGGDLYITFDGHQIELNGPAITVFEGKIDIDLLLANFPKGHFYD